MDNFLQSKSWDKFQQSLGRKTFWIGNNLVIKHILPLGKSFLYAPRVAIKDIKDFLQKTKKIAKKENSIFLRLEPANDNLSALKIKNLKFKICSNVQPADTLILDLTQSENKILENMHSKTRYNIRLAQKHKIKITKSSDAKDIDAFWKLAQITGNRDGFRYHPKNYYQKMLEILGPDNLKLYTAYIQNSPDNKTIKQSSNNLIPAASALIWFYKKTAIYLHGASDHKYRKFMAPYLIQWQAIRDGKKSGCKFYDFWGISPQSGETQTSDLKSQNKSALEIENCKLKIDSHPWAGITRFKTGFAQNGKIIHYPPCEEIVYQRLWYFLYKLLKK